MIPSFKFGDFSIGCFFFFQRQLIAKFVLRFCVIAILCLYGSTSSAQCTTAIQGSSFIINMGYSPQTNSSGLKPYGMIYDLITNYDVPILWCIKPTKFKDGADFNYNFTSYSGGTFVVPAQYIDPTVAGRITFWLMQGVQGTYAIAGSFSPVVYDTLTSFPKVMIDNGSGNQNIITGYYANAGIPASAYILGIPANLSGCYDIWTNPHDDPTWASHGYLHNFVTALKGNIWAECHEVSVMESVSNPVAPFQKLNFLTTTGLQCYSATKCGASPAHVAAPVLPETYQFPADPIMQFIGSLSGATQNGSEQWYIPNAGGQWNATTKRGVKTGNGVSPSEGVLLAYGPAYGNPANGTVMYEAGHNLSNSGTVAERVAAQRAYFNFVLYTGKQKRLTISTAIPASCTTLNSYPVSANVTSGSGPFTYQWTSSLGGTFSNSTVANSVYTAPSVSSDTIDLIRIKVSDACGRVNFRIICVPVMAIPLPIELLSFTAVPKESNVDASWCTASEINNDYFTLERSADGRSFEDVANIDGAGNSTYKRNYSYLDRSPLSGLSYYRLKQTDFDGQSSYSDIVPVKFSGNGFVVFPNPANNKVTILVDQKRNDKFIVQLLDISGRIVFRQNIEFDENNSNKFEFDVSPYARGVYTLICTSKSLNYVEPLVLR
jgi:hypothetical protein